MSLGEKLERRVLRPRLANLDGGIGEPERPGYGQPDAVDPSGYALADATYGDHTAHSVPGGALGEAGAAVKAGHRPASTDGRADGPSVRLYLGGQHAVRPVRVEYDGTTEPHAKPLVGDIFAETATRGGGDAASARRGMNGDGQRQVDAPPEYTAGPGRRPDARPLTR